ncbi:MAG: ATP-binding protein [Candidatus Methylomirabilales bacterium]
MALGLKTREVLAITALTFVVVAATSLVHITQLTRVTVQTGITQAELVSRQIYAQARRSLGAAAGDAWEVLRGDRELRSLLESSVAFSPDLLYVVLTDADGAVRLHSQPEQEGRPLEAKRDLRVLLSRNPVNRLVALYTNRTYEVPLPLMLNDRPFGTLRIGISTSLLRRELTASLRQSLALAGLALVSAWLVALALANLVIRPLRGLSREMLRLRRGEAEEPAGLEQGDEFGALASQLTLLGQQLETDRLKVLSEKAHLQQVVDQLEDPLIFCGAGGDVLFLNKAAEGVLGTSLAEAAGQPLDVVLPASHPLAPILAEATRPGGLRATTVTLPLDGKTKEYLISGFTVGSSQDSMGTMVVLKDLDSIRTLRSLVTYSAKLTALGRLTSGVAHEVKNPLNAMMIHLELLKEKLQDPPEGVRDSLQVIGTEIRRLDRAVQGFLKFVRPQELALRPVDLNALLGDAVAFLQPEWEAAGVRFALALDGGLPLVTADPELLRQAVLNVLLNACQAMPGGGTVRVQTEMEDRETVRIAIADEGVGIGPEELEKIFTLYYTTKPEGSGIGLSLVYRIIQLHDGTIQVSSEKGRGTTMTLRLPVA